jgi:hypothetical protein
MILTAVYRPSCASFQVRLEVSLLHFISEKDANHPLQVIVEAPVLAI